MSNGELSHLHHEHRSSHGRHRSSKRKLIAFLALALAVESLLLLFFIVNMSILKKENSELTMLEKKQTLELRQTVPELEKLRKEVEDLVASRLPHLSKLEFDRVVSVDKDYVKNVVFSVAGKGGEKRYEYKLVAHNNGLTAIHPQVDILFFDRVGIQVGLSQIGVGKDGTPTLDVIERGEIRSFSSTVELGDDVKPEYFMVRIKNPN